MLSVQVYAQTGDLLADLTVPSQKGFGGGGLRFTTNKHGFGSLTLPLARMSLAESFAAYEWPGTPAVVVTDGAGAIVWEGRVEDVAIVDGGVSVNALGYQRALYDLPYTGMWSATSLADWKTVTKDNNSTNRPEQYEMDNNNRLFIAPKKGETFGNGTHAGSWTYTVPHQFGAGLQTIDLEYDMLVPSGWKFYVTTYNYSFGSPSTINTVTSTGVGLTGTLSLSLSGAVRVNVILRNDSGASSTISDDTGVNYLKVTSVRLKTTTSAAVYASEIVEGMVAHVTAVNADQLSASTALIEATATDLNNETYQDMLPAAIIDRLASIHNYEWGVYENRQLYFRGRAAEPDRAWYVDVSRAPDIERSLENVRNSIYSVFRDAASNTKRTLLAADSGSVSRYGLTRREALQVQTTDDTEARTHRDVRLNDSKRRTDRATIETAFLYDANGGIWPLWAARSGDSITMRNLSPALTTSIDRIRTFRIGETEYDAEADSLTITPDEPTPTLVTLVARRGVGL